MFCHKCGTQIDKSSLFCHNCGSTTTNEKTKSVAPISNKAILFYGEDWRWSKIFAISSLPYFDVFIDEDNFYLIKLPNYNSGTLGLVLGLLLFNIIGARIGAGIGNSSDAGKRRAYRSYWVDSNKNITSDFYKNNIFLTIPVNELKNHLQFNNKKILINYNDKKIIIKKNKNGVENLKKSIEKYVL